MDTIWIDIETYGDVSLKDCGLYRYAQSSEILMVCWAYNDGPVVHGNLRALAEILSEGNVRVVGHNVPFEREHLTSGRGIPDYLAEAVREIEPKDWLCSMAKAASTSLPLGLEDLCMVLGAPQDKAKILDGKRLIRLFSVPQKVTKKQPKIRYYPEDHPEDWQLFIEYCKADVEAMRWCWNNMPGRNYEDNPFEMRLWVEDQKANARGVPVDLPSVYRTIELIEAEVIKARRELSELTNNEVTTQSQGKRIIEWCSGRGVHLKDLTAFTVEQALTNPRINEYPKVQRVLQIRQHASKSSTAKYLKFTNAVDGFLRYTLQFCGATRTGRWAGRLIQPQNFPRPDPEFYDEDNGIHAEHFLDSFLEGDIEFLHGPDTVIPYASTALRSMIKAPDEYAIVAADLAGIEARVLAWLARYEEKLQKIRNGADLYKELAANHIFHKPLNQITKADRFAGKVGELACGYQGWENAVVSMAKSAFGVVMPLAEGARIASAWRKANVPIVSYWKALEAGFVKAFTDRSPVKVGVVTFVFRGDFMLVQLPSGRCLHYHKPEVTPNGIRYYGNYNGAWCRLSLYGGKLAENIAQAVSRDVMSVGILRAADAGFEMFMTVHDEVVTLVKRDSGLTHTLLCELMAENPTWAVGLPLAAEGFTSKRYRK